MTLVCVAKHDRLRGWSGPEHDRHETLKVSELEAALRATYNTDAMMTMYAPLDVGVCHRINKAGVGAYPHPLFVTCFLADWDTPGHKPWEHPDQARALLTKWLQLPSLRTAGGFTSFRGLRLAQPVEPIPLHAAGPYFLRWLDELRENGIEWDPACRSPLRMWRLANVRRQNANKEWFQFASPVMMLEHMRAVAVDPLPTSARPESEPRPQRARPRAALPARQLDDVGDPWCWRVPVIAKACLEVRDNWHLLFMQLAGALLEKGAPPSRLVAICAAVSDATGADTRIDDRRASAETTLQQYANNSGYMGYKSLARDFRPVALALDQALTIHSDDDYVRWKQNTDAPPLPSADEVGTRIGEILRTVSAGVNLLVANTGAGKTRQTVQVASERANTPYKSPDAKGLRAPPHSRTVILVDKHSVGKELQAVAAQLGTPALRLFGPLSARDENGNPECIYHEAAQHIVGGGQPMQWVLCEGGGTRVCPKYDTCKARLGAEGPDNARIIIAPHAMANKVPRTSLVVIDERPQMLLTEAFTEADLETTITSLPDFAWRYAAALRPAVDAFHAFLRCEKEDSPHRSPVEVAKLHTDAVSETDMRFARIKTGVREDDIVAFAAAVTLDEKGKRCEVPPLHDYAVYSVRESVTTARRIGTASRVLATLLRVLASPDNVAVRVDADEQGKRSLKITFPNEPLLRVLRESNAAVVMDANAATDLPMYREAVGYEPPLHVLEARDACEVERTHIRATALTRTGLFRSGVLQITDALVRAVRDAVDWALEHPNARALGIITMKQVELALRAAWKPADGSPEREWEKLGLPASVLEQARERLGPILQRWPGTLEFAHFGDVRGRNDLQHLDALVTIGDPRPNLHDVALEAAYGKCDMALSALADLRCANELEQAHGRLRTVRRTKACRLLHVGKVRPSGKVWERGVLERDLRPGPMAKTGAMDAFELIGHVTRLGGARAAARRTEYSHSLILRCMQGKRTITDELATKLRAA